MFKNRSILLGAIFLTSCASNPPDCVGLQSRNLVSAVDAAQTALINGCHAHFDRYYDDLLSIAEGDPGPENKRAFSEFLVWSSDRGLLSKRQAQDYYNRYFNVKFMSLKGDYNNCSQTCPNKRKVLLDLHRLRGRPLGSGPGHEPCVGLLQRARRRCARDTDWRCGDAVRPGPFRRDRVCRHRDQSTGRVAALGLYEPRSVDSRIRRITTRLFCDPGSPAARR